MESGVDIGGRETGDGSAARPSAENEPTKMEVERYVNSIVAAVERVGAVEQALQDLVEEGWPTKLRGDRRQRFVQLEAIAREAETEARSVSPSQPALAEIHTNLRELTEAYARVAAAGHEVEDFFRSPEEAQKLLEAKKDAEREVQEWIQPLREVAAVTETDLTPIASALATVERPFGERLKRFGLRLLRPFRPIVPANARRLLVVPFMAPYGPLSPPAIVNYTRWVSSKAGWIPLLGWLAAVYTLLGGLALAAWYYVLLATWWLFAGWWISLILTAARRPEQPST